MTLEPAKEDTNTPDIVNETENDMNDPAQKTIVNDAPVGAVMADETVVSKSIPDTAPVSESFPHEAPAGMNVRSPVALLTPEDSQRFRTTWNEIQGKFVDEPGAAVQQADALVSAVVEQVTQMFADEHTSLEGQWKEGKEVSTEDLRQALLRYHSFFKRLVV